MLWLCEQGVTSVVKCECCTQKYIGVDEYTLHVSYKQSGTESAHAAALGIDGFYASLLAD